MLQVQRADERYRGGELDAGIDTRHAFSFSGFYDPDNLRFGALTACNEERLAPGAGFGEHPHRDLEIVTWVVEGELTHRDSAGHATVVRPGDLQRLSAGDGVRHTERNDGGQPLRFLQMWLVPDLPGGEPEYQVVRAMANGARYVLSGTAALHLRRPASGERVQVPDTDLVYLHVVRGRVRLDGEDAAGYLLAAGDAARMTRPRGMSAVAADPGPDGAGGAELLLWELGASPGPLA